MHLRIAVVLLLATTMFACNQAEPTTSGKGTEEDPLTDGKSDSFFDPTPHGTLRFGPENPADFAEGQLFHTWSFTTTGEAKVDLRTNVGQNVDTVMYLYHRSDPGDSWGHYVAKNDDFDGNIWSRITLDAEAGEYRVIVKPFKRALRGSFAVEAACDGDGCPSADATCSPDAYEPVDDTTGFTNTCAEALQAVLGSPEIVVALVGVLSRIPVVGAYLGEELVNSALSVALVAMAGIYALRLLEKALENSKA